MQRLDAYDYSLKFSGELLVLSIAIASAFLNIYYFSGQGSLSYSDKSLAAEYINRRPYINEKLYAKNSSIITTVAGDSLFFSQARADDFEGLNTTLFQPEEIGTGESQDGVLSEYAITKANHDSISELIAKQVKIYETKPGDTISSIASANNISPQTIKWANNLAGDAIKPGWQLVILPVDGTLHKASNNDTLPDIAKKYSADLEKIISYNLLENAEDIEPGQIFIVPGGKIPAPVAQNNSQKPKPGQPRASQPKSSNSGTGHIFPWGYCTWYVATRTHVPWGGNAKNWPANAKAYGAVITNSPAAGSIVVTTDNARYGHVAYVEKVEGDRFLISEMNYKGKGIISQRWLNIGNRTIRGFIHP